MLSPTRDAITNRPEARDSESFVDCPDWLQTEFRRRLIRILLAKTASLTTLSGRKPCTSMQSSMPSSVISWFSDLILSKLGFAPISDNRKLCPRCRSKAKASITNSISSCSAKAPAYSKIGQSVSDSGGACQSSQSIIGGIRNTGHRFPFNRRYFFSRCPEMTMIASARRGQTRSASQELRPNIRRARPIL